jgi:hypothetical protein
MPGMNSHRVVVALSLALAAYAVACIDPKCPKGYNKKGDTCYRIRDAGADGDAAESEADVHDGGGDLQDSADDAGPENAAPMDAGPCGDTGMRADCDGEVAETNACDPNPCEHDGKCASTAQGASCDCAGTGYTGDRCEEDGFDECAAPNSCTSPDTLV